MHISFWHYIGLVSLLLLLQGCGSNAKAPLRSLAQEKIQNAPLATSLYRVRTGDTLYSIAFRYGLNYQRLAAANGIAPPYRIRPGQRLRLEESAVASSYSEVIKPRKQKQAIAGNKQVKAQPSTPEVKEAPERKTPQSTSKPEAVTNTKQSSRFDKTGKVTTWHWPQAQSVKYRKVSNQQLFFSARQGASVYAAADGRVVYSGRGLRGYGLLVIIKHNQNYLSAYAFNDRVVVKEKQEVKSGQRIATVGKSPTGVVGLGFEIRYKGKPVNALKYLPQR